MSVAPDLLAQTVSKDDQQMKKVITSRNRVQGPLLNEKQKLF